MPIRFSCTCGKHLKARYQLAGRLTICPACGAPVAIPTGKATHRGIAAIVPPDRRTAPLSRERPAAIEGSTTAATAGCFLPIGGLASAAARRPGDRPATDPAAPSHAALGSAADAAEILFVRRNRMTRLLPRWRKAERQWAESVIYTLPLYRWLAGMAAALAFATTVTAGALSGMFGPDVPAEVQRWLPLAGAGLVALFLGIVCALLDDVLVLAMKGSMQVMTRPDLKVMHRSVWRWAACFAAGPALWLALAGVFWVRCGVVTLVDGLILTELIALACGQFLLSLVLTCRHGAHAFHPGLVLETVWSLGWRFAAASLATEAAFVSLLWFGSFALARLNESPLEGIFWIFTGWFAALALGAFVMRRLGLAYHRVAKAIQSKGRHAGELARAGT